MRVVGITAEGIGRISSDDRTREPEKEIGEGIARVAPIEIPLALILFAVGEERDPATNLRAEFEDVSPFDPRNVVCPFVDFEVLRLRTLIESRTVHRGVAAPIEVRKRANYAGPPGLLEAANPRFAIEIRSGQKRRQIEDRRQIVEAELVHQSRAQ